MQLSCFLTLFLFIFLIIFIPHLFNQKPHFNPVNPVCSANKLTGFYMMATLAFNELIKLLLHPLKPTKLSFINENAFT